MDFDKIMINSAYRIDWTESERGWGQSPDGYTLCSSKTCADKHIKDHWAKYPDGAAPDYYIRPSEPRLVEISDTQKEDLVASENGYVYYP